MRKYAIFFIMVLHPKNGWMRVGKPYGEKETAKSWVPFARKAWRGLKAKVVQCIVSLDDNGQPDQKSREKLDKKFNMEAR
jgi:hypothetical protein